MMQLNRWIAWCRRINRGGYSDFPARFDGPGRAAHAKMLDQLPSWVRVHHDVPVAPEQTIDHVTLSRHGMLAMQTVDWTGHVGVGPSRELMHNGQSRAQDARELLRRVMRLREQLDLNGPDDPYIQAAFVICRAEMARPVPQPARVRLFHVDHTTHHALKPRRDGRRLPAGRVRAIDRRLREICRGG